MAILSRALSSALPALVAVLVLLPPSDRARAGTDVFGSGTGGFGSHGTSVYAAPNDASGWGSNATKPLTPPAPPPAAAELPSAAFGTAPIGTGNFRGNFGGSALNTGVGSRNTLDGTLPPLGQ
jgi:hypothetical protein